jgi:hypothetical protein
MSRLPLRYGTYLVVCFLLGAATLARGQEEPLLPVPAGPPGVLPSAEGESIFGENPFHSMPRLVGAQGKADSTPFSGRFTPDFLVMPSELEVAGALERKGRYAEALVALEPLVEREPDRPHFRSFRAYLRCMAMRHDDAVAIRLAEQDLEIANRNLGDPFTTGVRGIVAFRKRQYDQAITHLTVAIERNCDSPDFRMFRGISYTQLGDLEHAIADFEQAVHKAPGCVPAYRFLASCHGALGHHALALKQFRKGLELAPGDDSLRIECIEYALSFGQLDSALADLDRLIADHPDWPHSYLVRGIVRWVGGKDLKLVRSDLDLALARETRDWSFYALRAVLNYRQAEYARALGDALRCSLVLTRTKFAVRWHVETYASGHGRFFIGLFWRYNGGAARPGGADDPHDLQHRLVDLGLKTLWGAAGSPVDVN